MPSTDKTPPSPYDFTPTPKRNLGSDLGDRVPTGHHRLESDFYTGTLLVKMTTTTEVLVPDAYIQIDEIGHVTKSTRRHLDGKPLIPATSVKGMLRSAYEAVTNSRLGVLGVLGEQVRQINSAVKMDKEHKPATKLEELSPADRVFGWVSESGADNPLSSYMGQLSIGPITCDYESGIKKETRTLKVLASPMSDPRALKHYADDSAIKGRKIYPHHQNWKVTGATTNQQGRLNQTFDDVIPANITFTFQISLRNLSAAELGALLFVLEPSTHFHHRLGGGKPLGFGSVQLTVTKPEATTGAEWTKALKELRDPTWMTQKDLEELRTNFTDVVANGQKVIREKYLGGGAGKPTSELQYPAPQRPQNRGQKGNDRRNRPR